LKGGSRSTRGQYRCLNPEKKRCVSDGTVHGWELAGDKIILGKVRGMKLLCASKVGGGEQERVSVLEEVTLGATRERT